jgi:hypothetical protein
MGIIVHSIIPAKQEAIDRKILVQGYPWAKIGDPI